MSATNRESLPKWLRDDKKWEGYKVFHLYTYSGANLIEEVNSCDPQLVIDVGCGHNRFKGRIKNLVGFDIVPRRNIDMCCSILDAPFVENQADVVLALGVVQFGDIEQVVENLEKIVSWVKPGGYIVMRANTKHTTKRFGWTEQHIHTFTNILGLEMFKPIRTESLIGTTAEDLINSGITLNRVSQALDDTPDMVEKVGFLSTNRLVWWWKKPGLRTNTSVDDQTHEFIETVAKEADIKYINDPSTT
jgi:SAM-dependent methyltransferase